MFIGGWGGGGQNVFLKIENVVKCLFICRKGYRPGFNLCSVGMIIGYIYSNFCLY